MTKLQPMQTGPAGASIVTALAFVLSALSQVGLAQDTSNGEYTWSAELVSFDEEAGTITVKSRVEARADVGILDELMEGDRVTLRWTGRSWAAGVAAMSREHTSASPDALVLPVEFVATEMEGRYIVYRLPVPEGSVARIRGLEPGSWVTATSPRNAPGPSEAMTEVRPYNDVS